MKFIWQNTVLFVLFVFAFSALTSSCTKYDVASNAPANTAAPEKTPSEYPPMPAAIMQEQIKMIDGTTITLNDKKGKVVLVNLWATWCGPCRAEMPHLVEMQDTYREKGFEVIGLDVDPESVEEINAFAREMKLNYALGWTGEPLSEEFRRLGKFDGIPQSFLIDRNGHLRGLFLGGSKKVVTSMKETVEKIVNES